MKNQTVLSELLFSGLSDLPSLQLPLFLFFFLIYLLTLTWNLLIIFLIVTDSHLHTPMYFFLGNLASLDLCFSSVTVSRTLFDLHTRSRRIGTRACLAQLFFYLFFASSEVFLLAVMSYDRYVAICRPLHYMQIMHWKLCVQLSFSVWFLGFAHSIVQTLYAAKLTFCKLNVIENFFCDLPQLFQISCSDIHVNIQLLFFLGGVLAAGTLMLTFLPYVYIFNIVLSIPVTGNRSKVFSTCSSHLTVVFVFYGTTCFNYFRPNAGDRFDGGTVLAVCYAVIIPLLNPLIYSLRNAQFRTAFQDGCIKMLSVAFENSCPLPSKWKLLLFKV